VNQWQTTEVAGVQLFDSVSNSYIAGLISSATIIDFMQKPSVAIVILNWNGQKFLQQFLPSVLASSYSNYRVIVADNASTDDSVLYLTSNYSEVEIISLAQNFGFAKGYNEALKQIKSDYYVLLNSDVEVEKNWIDPVIDLMELDNTIGAVQPKILQQSNKKVFEYAGAAGGWIDNFGYPFARGRVFDTCEEDHGQYDTISGIFWASGAAIFVRSAVYHEMNGLDEYFFAHMEEIDLCWRMQLAGYKVTACPLSSVYHVGGGTLPVGNQKKVYLNFRNNLIMLAKNLPIAQVWWKVPVRFLLDAVTAWRQLMKGSPGYFGAVVKAHAGFLYWLFLKQSGSRFPHKRGVPSVGWYKGSVVKAYFLKKRVKFSEIVSKNN
jgi:GT2 family glycosyltransferase